MVKLQVNAALLQAFEQGLDPARPEESPIPARVLGYGEISTVLQIDGEENRDLAYKRMPMFYSTGEAQAYERLYEEYATVMQEQIGVRLVPGVVRQLKDEQNGRVIVYIIQKKLPPNTIAHQTLHLLSRDDIKRLLRAILREINKVFLFNESRNHPLEVGFDGQISNWTIENFDPQTDVLPETIKLAYFDTSTPLLRRNGKEQLNPELFLRSAPSFLVWIIRLLFLEDVMTRYYDRRQVIIDLVANVYKEQRPDLVPELVETVNQFFAGETQKGRFKPVTVKEVKAYYREDAWIWRIYLAFRRLDRALHKVLGKDYPYVLPGKIKR